MHLLEPPHKGCIRFMHINTGGINPQAGYTEYKILLTNLQQIHSDVFSVNENCLDTSQPKNQKELYDARKAINKYSTHIFHTSLESFPKAYRPGGTMVGTTYHISGRIEDKGTDNKGRWTWVQLTGKKGKKVLTISAYRVSQTYSSEAGYSTAYMQQYRAFIKKISTTLSPNRDASWTLLLSYKTGRIHMMMAV